MLPLCFEEGGGRLPRMLEGGASSLLQDDDAGLFQEAPTPNEGREFELDSALNACS